MNENGATIAAVSTPPGKGGVALIRISGAEAAEIGGRVFFPMSGKPLSECEDRRAVYGRICCRGDMIDDGIAVLYRAPASYTGEDMVEIFCHGGMLLTRTVLQSVFFEGAVSATAGEFTRRAFINGKITLSEAESVGLLLDASSEAQLKLAARGGDSSIGVPVERIRMSLVHLLGSIYAKIDYPDEDLAELSDDEIVKELTEQEKALGQLIGTYRTGHAIAEGIPTVICGLPNVGKSSLYNALCGTDDAIVTEQAGTTRDILRRTVSMGQVTLRIADTAGIRDGGDRVERMGIDRALDEIDRAELILCVFDASMPLSASDIALIEKIKDKKAAKIAVLNKTDISCTAEPGEYAAFFDRTVYISAAKGETEQLQDAVNQLFTDEKIVVGQTPIVSCARQAAALERAMYHIGLSKDAFARKTAQDAASTDIELACSALGEIDGRAVCEDVVTDIFSRFCVGK